MNTENTNTHIEHFSLDRELTPLLKTYKKLLIFQTTILYFVILASGITVYLFETVKTPLLVYGIALSLSIVIFTLRICIIIKGFPLKAYSVGENEIHFQTGYINRKFISIPINRIQHIEIKEGILSRILGLAQIKLYTAGNGSHDLSLKGISLETAKEIKNQLTQTIKPYDED